MGEIIPFPVWIIPFPVFKINFETLGSNDKCFVKNFLIRGLQGATKVKIAKGLSVSQSVSQSDLNLYKLLRSLKKVCARNL